MAKRKAERNPSEEVIQLGQLRVHFLVTGDNSSGSIAVFELMVAGGARLMAPAHSHNHDEETIYGVVSSGNSDPPHSGNSEPSSDSKKR